MTNLNPNITNNHNFQQKINFKAETQSLPVSEQAPVDVQIPDMYYNPNAGEEPKSTVETIKQFDMMGLVYPWLEHPILMGGTAAGLALGVDKFSKACGGDYESSLVGKTAKLGDSIQNSAFVKSEPVQAIVKGTKSAKLKLKKIFRNSDLINAIRKTPSSPEWSMPRDEMLSMQQRQVHEFNHITNLLKLTSDEAVALKDLGVDTAENKFLKEFFKNSKGTDKQITSAIQLKRLGWTDDAIKSVIDSDNILEIVKSENIKRLGTTKEALIDLQKCKNITETEIKAVEEMCLRANGLRVGQGKYNFLGPFQPFARNIEFQELYNRLHSMRGGAKTKLGKMLSTFLQRCHRGFTFGGGKLGVLAFVSPILVETMIDTYKADKKEKLGTAVHGSVHAISWVFTFPLALKIMHHLAGAQYAGMDKSKVEECRKLISEFNKKVDDKVLNDKTLYDKELKALRSRLKELRTVKGQNLLTKISKQIGRFVTMDLENIKSYRGGNVIMNTIRKIPSFFRNLGGIPLRFAIWGGISMGVLDTLINKSIKKTFGNFYDRFKEEEHQNNKKQQKAFLKQDLQDRLYEAQRNKLTANNENQVSDKKTNSVKKEEFKMQNPFEKESDKRKTLAEKEVKNIETTTTTPEAIIQKIEPQNERIKEPSEIGQKTNSVENIIQQEEKKSVEDFNKKTNVKEKVDNYTYIPSSENSLAKKEEDSYKYIPSQKAANINKSFDNSALQKALARADIAEQRALQTLAGNFDNM